MIFTATSLASFIAANACVSPPIAPVVIGLIIGGEQSRNSLSIHDNTGQASFTPSTASEAIALAKALMGHGHDLDLGIGQINTRNLSWTGLSVEAAFDPCQNVTAAAKVVFAKYNGNPPDAVKVAYAARVTAAVPTTDMVATEPITPSLVNDCPPAWDTFAHADCLKRSEMENTNGR